MAFRRDTTTSRGYGRPHQVLRARWARLVAGGGVMCARCGGLIAPAGACPRCGRASCGWDLGHDDEDRTRWTGPEHACCNRRRGQRVRPRVWRPSEQW